MSARKGENHAKHAGASSRAASGPNEVGETQAEEPRPEVPDVKSTPSSIDPGHGKD